VHVISIIPGDPVNAASGGRGRRGVGVCLRIGIIGVRFWLGRQLPNPPRSIEGASTSPGTQRGEENRGTGPISIKNTILPA